MDDSDPEEVLDRADARRAERKREDRLWQIAEALLTRKPGALDRLALDEGLRDAVDIALAIKPSTGRRRQTRRIVQFLRDGDSEQIARGLGMAEGGGGSTADHVQVRAVREAQTLVSEGDAALQALMERQPDADRSRLRQLVRAVQKHTPEADAPASKAHQKAMRTLVAYLVSLSQPG